MFCVPPWLFNQPLGAWNVDKVKDMHGMFYKAKGFRQDLGWCVNDDVNMKYAFQKSRCECTSCGVMHERQPDDFTVLRRLRG